MIQLWLFADLCGALHCFFICMWVCEHPPPPPFFAFLGPQLMHMEVPRLGVKFELQLLAFATATATQYLSHICNLHNSSRQCWIPNPLSNSKDWTGILMDPSHIHFCWATVGIPKNPSCKSLLGKGGRQDGGRVGGHTHPFPQTHTHKNTSTC